MKLRKKFFSAKKNAFFRSKDNFLIFLILTLAFVISTPFTFSRQNTSVQKNKAPSYGHQKVFPPLPVLGDATDYPVLSAQAVYAVDLDSGIALYEKNPDAPLLPASTTKIITALVALDTYNSDAVLTVDKGANIEGQKMGLYLGEQIKFEDILYGMLVYSANDAAMTIADNYPDGYPAFIAAMNAKAKELNMANSRFDNPVGLDGNQQRSTARDLVRASEVAMRNPTFAKIVGTKQITVGDLTGKVSYNLKNVNELLGTVPGVVGIKTGWTLSARENLVTYVVRNNHRVLISMLGSTDRFGETKELIDWIFAGYNWTLVNYPN